MSQTNRQERSPAHYCPGCTDWGTESEAVAITTPTGKTTICWSCREILDNLGLSD
ncbi:hypothetical protein ACIBCO_02970 [Streptomyces violascens]|uniref:hypothetical protein n=1 Tax=Streptomyces violascens TaxID=67381 RepID=UPI003791F186